jgi:hypothetical protein
MSLMDEVAAILDRLPPEERRAIEIAAALHRADRLWDPTPDSPQELAFQCQADELFYGGSAGSGKTDLGLGLALTGHKRSLILRRVNKDAVKLVERVSTILGSRDGFNGQQQCWRFADGRQIDFAGCEYEDDKQRHKGNPHDLIYFDEGSDFLYSQYRFICGWNRSTDPAQRCRVVVGSNPPTSPEGLWVVRHWAPWLDPMHHNPAQPGELRWFTTGQDGSDLEVDGPGPHLVNGDPFGPDRVALYLAS